MTIERICTICHKRIKAGSKLKIYCQCNVIGSPKMSCINCEIAQSELSGDLNHAYIRIDEANVALVGCKYHMRRAIELINKGIQSEIEPGEDE